MRWFGFLIACLCLPTVVNAAWHRAESDNFILIGDMSAEQLRSKAYDLERFHQLLVVSTGANNDPPLIKLRVFVVRNFDAVSEIADLSNIGGFYDPAMRGPLVVVPRLTPRQLLFATTPRQILFHEYAHHFMFVNFPATYPAWYIEGFAEFYANVDFGDENEVTIGYAPSATRDVLSLGIWERYDEILSNNRANTPMTYAQAWALVHYAHFNQEGDRLLRQYLDALVAGQDGRAAYEQTFAVMALDRVVRNYSLQRRIPGRQISLPSIQPGTITLQSLSREAGEVAILFPRRPSQLQGRVERLARRFPDNPQIHAELAISHRQRREFELGLVAANRALAINPNHIGGLLIKAEVLKDLASAGDDADDPRWAESRDLFLLANRLDPTNAQALHGYYDSFPDGAERPEFALLALESARTLVPQNEHLRADLAEEYVALERYHDALNELMPILQSPHREEDERVTGIEQQIRQAFAEHPVSP